MGGSLDYRVYKSDDKNKIEKRWRQDQEMSAAEDGDHTYAGVISTLGESIVWKNLQFKTEEEAVEYISERHHKGGSPWGISFFLPTAPTEEDKQKAKEAEKRVQELRNELNELRGEAMKKIKSKPFVTCPKCQSQLNTAKIDRPRCPFCPGEPDNMSEIYKDAGYLTDPADQEIINAVARDVAKAMEESRIKPRPSGQIGWVVGGVCPS